MGQYLEEAAGGDGSYEAVVGERGGAGGEGEVVGVALALAVNGEEDVGGGEVEAECD